MREYRLLETMWNFGLFLLFSTAFVSISGDVSKSIEISSDVVMEGDDVTVRCRVVEFTPANFIYWMKKQGDDVVQVGTNNYLNEIFTETGRYFAEAIEVEGEVVFMLNIRGAILEDSGEIGCYLPTLETADEYVSLTVMVPVSSVSLYALDANDLAGDPVHEFMDGEEILFSEGDQYYFRCLAQGSNPAAEFDITLGETNLNDKFTQNSDFQLIDATAPGLNQIVYSSSMTTHDPVEVTYEENAMVFTCSASVPGYEAMSIHVKPILKFAPVITCPVLVSAPMYDKNVMIECRVKSDPPLEFLEWSWFPHASNMSLEPGGEEGHYTVHKLEVGETDDEVITVLNIEKIFDQAFRDYYVRVRNSLGDSVAKVTLDRDMTGESLGAASSVTSSLVLLVSTALYLAIFKHV